MLTTLQLLDKARSGKLTCSEVAQILADQITSTGQLEHWHLNRTAGDLQTTDKPGHSHMHLVDGFRRDDRILNPTNQATLYLTTRPYDHLSPQADSPIPPLNVRAIRERMAGGRLNAADDGTVFMDPNRSATDYTYSRDRTDLPEIEKKEPVFGRSPPENSVLRQDGKKFAPVPVDFGPCVGDDPAVCPARKMPGDTNLYVMSKTQGHEATCKMVKQVTRRVIVTPPVAHVDSTPAHTMFEDSESMVMHVTAGLLSDAGKAVLQTLFEKGPKHTGTVGVFSKTAVRAVNAAFATNAPEGDPSLMIRRVAESNHDRTPTGAFREDKRAFDHVVLVLGHRSDGRLTVVTAYPTDETTQASIGCDTTADEDVAEHVFGTHTKMAVTNPLPQLRW